LNDRNSRGGKTSRLPAVFLPAKSADRGGSAQNEGIAFLLKSLGALKTLGVQIDQRHALAQHCGFERD
jgi:hypothetical protein